MSDGPEDLGSSMLWVGTIAADKYYAFRGEALPDGVMPSDFVAIRLRRSGTYAAYHVLVSDIEVIDGSGRQW
jgi:hypothetical protein